jgi:hypothetical protein
MPIDGRAHVLGMEFGVGDLLLRYDFFKFCLNKQTIRISFQRKTTTHTQKQRAHGIAIVIVRVAMRLKVSKGAKMYQQVNDNG